jgi:acyl-CoA synthetase (AMP-forming)/AMP-acid ligase II
MTETNAYGPQNAGPSTCARPTSCGRTVPVVEIRVTDEPGKPLAPARSARSGSAVPNLIRGYWNRPDATAETIVDGWLRSGDLGRTDDEGFLYVEDRAKDMVLRAGENVYCAEVEAAIYEHPPSTRPRCSACRTSGSAKRWRPASTEAGRAARIRGAPAARARAARGVQGADRDRVRRRAAAAQRVGKILKRQIRDELARARLDTSAARVRRTR